MPVHRRVPVVTTAKRRRQFSRRRDIRVAIEHVTDLVRKFLVHAGQREFGETFRRLRGENYELLKDLPESAFDRVGSHTENGPMSLRRLLQGYADHAESHARQLQALRAEFRKVKGKK